MKGYMKVKISESFFSSPKFMWIVVEILGKRTVKYSDEEGYNERIYYLVKDSNGNMFEESSIYVIEEDQKTK